MRDANKKHLPVQIISKMAANTKTFILEVEISGCQESGKYYKFKQKAAAMNIDKKNEIYSSRKGCGGSVITDLDPLN